MESGYKQWLAAPVAPVIGSVDGKCDGKCLKHFLKLGGIDSRGKKEGKTGAYIKNYLKNLKKGVPSKPDALLCTIYRTYTVKPARSLSGDTFSGDPGYVGHSNPPQSGTRYSTF